jgi:quinol monooxygenase YgiN
MSNRIPSSQQQLPRQRQQLLQNRHSSVSSSSQLSKQEKQRRSSCSIFGLIKATFFIVFVVAAIVASAAAVSNTTTMTAAATPTTASTPTTTTNTVFSLLVTLHFSALDYKHQFLQDIQPLVDYVSQHEPDTIAYTVLQSDKEPLQLLILERYVNKDVAFVQVHRSSTPFQTFRPKLQAMVDAGHVVIEGQSYNDMHGMGFVGRQQQP